MTACADGGTRFSVALVKVAVGGSLKSVPWAEAGGTQKVPRSCEGVGCIDDLKPGGISWHLKLEDKKALVAEVNAVAANAVVRCCCGIPRYHGYADDRPACQSAQRRCLSSRGEEYVGPQSCCRHSIRVHRQEPEGSVGSRFLEGRSGCCRASGQGFCKR